VAVVPSKYRSMVKSAIKEAERLTGLKVKRLKRVTIVRGDRETRSSMGDIVARVPGRECVGHNDTDRFIVVAARPDNGYVPAWAVVHEVCHQITRDHDFFDPNVSHEAVFKNKGIPGWV
jgi:hypothetical protein